MMGPYASGDCTAAHGRTLRRDRLRAPNITAPGSDRATKGVAARPGGPGDEADEESRRPEQTAELEPGLVLGRANAWPLKT